MIWVGSLPNSHQPKVSVFDSVWEADIVFSIAKKQFVILKI